jgi:hypothetical protein
MDGTHLLIIRDGKANVIAVVPVSAGYSTEERPNTATVNDQLRRIEKVAADKFLDLGDIGTGTEAAG